MSFRALAPVRTWSGSVAAVRASVADTRRGPSLRLLLSAPLLKKLGWGAADRFAVMIGENESAGRLRIALASKGADDDACFAAGKLPKGSGLRLVVFGAPGMPAGDHAPRDCLHFIGAGDGDAFVEMTLPVWPGGVVPDGRALRDPAKEAAPPGEGKGRGSQLPVPDSPPQSAARTAFPQSGERKEGAAAPAKFTINETLFTLLLTKAGIAFGVSRQEVLAAGKGGLSDGDAAMDAQCAVIDWLDRQGYARAVAMKKFGIGAEAAGDAIDAAAALKKSSPKPFAKFEAVVADAIRDAGLRP